MNDGKIVKNSDDRSRFIIGKTTRDLSGFRELLNIVTKNGSRGDSESFIHCE